MRIVVTKDGSEAPFIGYELKEFTDSHVDATDFLIRRTLEKIRQHLLRDSKPQKITIEVL